MFKNSRFVSAEAAYPPTMHELWRDGVDFGILKAKLRHRRVMIAWSVLLGALLAGLVGCVYALARNPTFSASSDLLISNTTLQMSGPDAVVAQVLVENSLLESAMVLMKSGQVLERVVDRLGLDTIEAVLPKRLDILRVILPPMPGEITVRDNSHVAMRQAAVANLRANLRVERIGASLIITVRASAVDAAGAAALSGAVA